jgi:ABC-type multidrug transport system fused ATPase/permease subunit
VAGEENKEVKKKKLRLSEAWREARDLIAAHKKRLALGFGLLMINRVAGLVLPATSKYLIDEVVAKQRGELLVPLAVAGGIATLVQAITSFSLAQVLGVAAQGAINEMRKSVQRHVTLLPVRYFDSTQSGVLISRIMSDAEGIRNLVGTGIVQLVGGIVTAIIALGVLFYLNWKMTAIILVVLALFGFAMTFAFKYLRPLFRDRGKINAEITGRLAQSLGGIRIVKAYTAEPKEQQIFSSGVDQLFANIKKSITGISLTSAASITILGGIGVLLTVVGGNSILAGAMTMGDFVMYLVFVAMLTAPVIEIASIGTQITEAFAGMDRIREITRMSTEDEGDELRMPCPDIRGDVSFENVSFEYNAGKPALKSISFESRAGTTTALVGSSGGGKSTLVSLVMAFNRPLTGRVSVDGRDLTTVKLRDYRAQLGVVLQDNFLFDGTIIENVSFARPAATRAEIEAACRTAHCEEFVKGFEKGYDTVVGERGIKLSGGQRQRIAIARALLARPRILILDEATSSLDSESEAMIQDGLNALRQSRTTFVIAHRLSTIRSADQILVIEHGEIVERGTHHELLTKNGRYRELYDRQYHFEHERFINPGEDFTPEAKSDSIPKARAPSTRQP